MRILKYEGNSTKKYSHLLLMKMQYRKILTTLQLESEKVRQNISLLETKVSTSEQKELIATLKNTNNDYECL